MAALCEDDGVSGFTVTQAMSAWVNENIKNLNLSTNESNRHKSKEEKKVEEL